MKIYYARPISFYGTKQDERDINDLIKLGFTVVNPNTKEIQERYKTEGFDVFLSLVKDCNALAFRSFLDMKIGAGVVGEINKAIEIGLPVIELPTLLISRNLNIDETRNYLKYLGNR